MHAGQSPLLTKSLELVKGSAPASGWVAIGCSWDTLRFDNFSMHEAHGGKHGRSRCGNPAAAGQLPVIVACGSAEALDGMRWDVSPGGGGGTIRLRNSSLCLEAVPLNPPLPPPSPPPPLPPRSPGGMAWSTVHHAAEVKLSAMDEVATWLDACDKVVLLNTTTSHHVEAWQSTVYQTNGYADIGWCTLDIDVEGPWAGFQTGKAWLFRSAMGGRFKVAKDDNQQGVRYGKSFGRGDNITAIRHSALSLEFAINDESLGVIKLKDAMPPGVFGCASMCARDKQPAAILSLLRGPVPPPIPVPPPAPLQSVRLAQCNETNPNQLYTYDQELRTVRNQGGCLMLPQTGMGSLTNGAQVPDPTAFTAVKLGDCPSGRGAVGDAVAATMTAERLGGGEMDSKNTNLFTWSPELGFLRSIFESSNLCVGVCG
eukprot:COSAG05_NODE_4309_length_1570_cov_3.063902_2_plen_427_part_00